MCYLLWGPSPCNSTCHRVASAISSHSIIFLPPLPHNSPIACPKRISAHIQSSRQDQGSLIQTKYRTLKLEEHPPNARVDNVLSAFHLRPRTVEQWKKRGHRNARGVAIHLGITIHRGSMQPSPGPFTGSHSIRREPFSSWLNMAKATGCSATVPSWCRRCHALAIISRRDVRRWPRNARGPRGTRARPSYRYRPRPRSSLHSYQQWHFAVQTLPSVQTR